MDDINFISTKGNIYGIELDDLGEIIKVKQGSKVVGHISFRFIEGDLPILPDVFHITDLALSRCKREGVGRRCLEIHREVFASPITAGRLMEVGPKMGVI